MINTVVEWTGVAIVAGIAVKLLIDLPVGLLGDRLGWAWNECETKSVTREFRDAPLIMSLKAVVIAPLVEEYIFRYGLTRDGFRYRHLLIALPLLAILFVDMPEYLRWALYVVMCGIGAWAFWQEKPEELTKAQYPFRSIFRYPVVVPVVITSVLFGLGHRFERNLSNLDVSCFNPLFYLGFILGGLILAYVRLRFGFRYSVLVHTLNNAIGAVLMLLIMWLRSLMS